MLKASFYPYTLRFAFTARTSREVFHEKLTYILKVSDGEKTGVGEVAVFPSLQPSFKDRKTFERELQNVSDQIADIAEFGHLPENSAISFGVETALCDLFHGGTRLPFGVNDWNSGLKSLSINGLVWMSDIEEMERQIASKLESGFKCLKLKIGANNFDKELELLSAIRQSFPENVLELRLDANGCFTAADVLNKLEQMSVYGIHSIEQPLPRNSESMKETIRYSPIPIALDEDMIERWWCKDEMEEWLGNLSPAYIILKPSLVGGFGRADNWIDAAKSLGIGWWATSALESNIGLNAIAQWLGSRNDAWNIRHGLGTGQIYVNNFDSPIFLNGENLGYSPSKKWSAL